MSLPRWSLSAAVAAIVGFGLLGVYSYMDYSYVDTEAKSAPKPIIPVWVSGDEGLAPAQQSSEMPASTALPTQSLPSGATRTPVDPWASEGMEAVSREPFIEESNEVDDGDDLTGAFSDHANNVEGSVPSEVESPSSENTSVYSQEPAQPPTKQDTAPASQQALTVAPPPGSPTGTETSSVPPTDTQVPRGPANDAGEGADKLTRVLMVEDLRASTESLATKLNGEPELEVIGQTSKAAECRNFVAGGEGVDVSIVDLALADGQGLDLIGELRKSCPDVPVLVLTTSLDPGDRERVMKAGADAVLGKGADPDEIVSAARRLASSQAPPTAPVPATNTEGAVGEPLPKNSDETTTPVSPTTG